MNYYLHIFLKGYLYPRVSDIKSILKDLNLAVDLDKVYVRKEKTLCDVNEFVYVTDTDCHDKVMDLMLGILSREDVSDDSKMDVMLKPGEYFVASCQKYEPYLDFDKSFIKVTDDNYCYEYEYRGCLYDFAKSKMYLKLKEEQEQEEID